MRVATLALVTLLALTGVTLVAPGANAWDSCNGVDDSGCPGLVCIWNPNNPAPCNVVYVPRP